MIEHHALELENGPLPEAFLAGAQRAMHPGVAPEYVFKSRVADIINIKP
jgi:hypothetical protein